MLIYSQDTPRIDLVLEKVNRDVKITINLRLMGDPLLAQVYKTLLIFTDLIETILTKQLTETLFTQRSYHP